MKNLISVLIAITPFFGVMAAVPGGYYSSLEGKCGLELKKAAKDKVASHTVISYGNKTWEAFRSTDVKEVNGELVWWDMYSNNEVPVASGHDGLNIEHSVANSWWGHTQNAAYKDLFHLNPSDATANNRKGNYPLGEISGTPSWTNGVTNVGSPVSGQGGGSTKVYEPHDDYKGDFARAFMYMFTVYDDITWKENTAWMYSVTEEMLLQPWASDLLIRWSQEDPVDEKERNRNEAIYKIQGNRNPFIDYPTLAEHIWGDKKDSPFSFAGIVDPNPDPNPDPDPANPDELLFENFEESANMSYYEDHGWTNYVESGDLSGWFIKSYNGNAYASATAYKGTADGGPYEDWLYTPDLKLSEGQTATLSFRTQGAYGCDDSYMEVYLINTDISSSDPAYMSKLDANICTPNPDGMKPVYCDWVESGDIPLSDLYDAPLRNFRVAFRYYSAAGGTGKSATYCLDDVKIKADSSTGVDVLPPALQSVRVEGNSIVAPEGSRIFDLQGRRCAPVDLRPGVYLVAVPGHAASKVIVK